MLTDDAGVENVTSTGPSRASKKGIPWPAATTDTTFGVDGANELIQLSATLATMAPPSGFVNVIPGYRFVMTVPSDWTSSKLMTCCAEALEHRSKVQSCSPAMAADFVAIISATSLADPHVCGFGWDTVRREKRNSGRAMVSVRPPRPSVRIPMGTFEALYEQHVQAVFRFAMSVVGRRDLAEDLTSEAFL